MKHKEASTLHALSTAAVDSNNLEHKLKVTIASRKETHNDKKQSVTTNRTRRKDLMTKQPEQYHP